MKQQIPEAVMDQIALKSLFNYRSDGNLVYKVDVGRRIKIGDVAGSKHADGYVRVCINGKSYLAHRLIWLYHNGYLPEQYIDHRDRRRYNNRVNNLREEGPVCNIRNTGNFGHNTSGVKGVNWNNGSGKWNARIIVSRKQYHLGRHPDFLEAVCHRLAAEQAENWAGCDDCSPAYQYVKSLIPTIK